MGAEAAELELTLYETEVPADSKKIGVLTHVTYYGDSNEHKNNPMLIKSNDHRQLWPDLLSLTQNRIEALVNNRQHKGTMRSMRRGNYSSYYRVHYYVSTKIEAVV